MVLKKGGFGECALVPGFLYRPRVFCALVPAIGVQEHSGTLVLVPLFHVLYPRAGCFWKPLFSPPRPALIQGNKPPPVCRCPNHGCAMELLCLQSVNKRTFPLQAKRLQTVSQKAKAGSKKALTASKEAPKHSRK